MSMMKGFSNVFRIPELRKKILITLGLVFVCRLISQIPTPGVDWTVLNEIVNDFKESSQGGMLDWFEVFTGGALGQCAIGFLSIWPYISAQIAFCRNAGAREAEKGRRERQTAVGANYPLFDDCALRCAVVGNRHCALPSWCARHCIARGSVHSRKSRDWL